MKETRFKYGILFEIYILQYVKVKQTITQIPSLETRTQEIISKASIIVSCPLTIYNRVLKMKTISCC